VHPFIQVTDCPIRVSQSFTGAESPWVVTPMIMIEIQYSGTALLLLVNLHQNNRTVHSNYVFII